MATFETSFTRLSQVDPQPKTSELLAELVPPREFKTASFDNYLPNAAYPSQRQALDAAKSFATGKSGSKLFGKKSPTTAGIYLDGGFGVGKTHLLAATFHAFKGAKAFGSFMQYTSLVGALGFAKALEKLAHFQLIAIDEFELDDPGDTMIMSRLINDLGARGVRFAATSNTPPNALGEGRFAAADFLREIQGISAHFDMLRVDGDDYRHRPVGEHSVVLDDSTLEGWLDEHPIKSVALDDFSSLLRHLATLHPSKYGLLLKGVSAVGLTDVKQINDQSEAIRFVSFVDRAYEAQVALRNTGTPLTDVFRADHLEGGYRKKYLRAISRIGAMTAAS